MRYTQKHVRALAFQIRRDEVSTDILNGVPTWVVKNANRLANEWQKGTQKTAWIGG